MSKHNRERRRARLMAKFEQIQPSAPTQENIAWRSLENYPDGVRFLAFASPDQVRANSPVRDDHLRVMVFTSQELAQQFMLEEFTPNEETLAEIQLMGLPVPQPVILTMGQENWGRFQHDFPGRWTEYSTLEEAKASMERKRVKFRDQISPTGRRPSGLPNLDSRN